MKTHNNNNNKNYINSLDSEVTHCSVLFTVHAQRLIKHIKIVFPNRFA